MVANTTLGAIAQVQWTDGATASVSGSKTAGTVGAGGMLTINGTGVTIGPGLTTAQTVTAINTAMTSAGSTVTATLNSGGALVLASTIAGAVGTVNVATPTGSLSTDLGLVATSVSGSDAMRVNIGGGKLQGLIESRDKLLQDRIDGVNALAGRVIESVNSLHASGVGLDGKGGRNFFAGTDASTIAVHPQITATGGTDKVAAGRLYASPSSPSGYASAAGDSSNAVALAQLQNLTAQRFTGAGGLVPGQTYGPAQLVGLDLSGAAPNTTYTFSVVAGALSISPPGTGSAAVTVGVDPAGNSVFNVDTGSSRLTLSAPAGTTLAAAMAGLNGTSVTTIAGPSTMGDQYAKQIAALGVEAQTAKGPSANQSVLINQLTTQR